MTKRYAHWVGADVPLVSYEGASLETATARWLIADHQGSIIAGAHPSGATAWINAYDEYGIPGSSNTGRFQYTGQAWLPEIGMYHYRARAYSPTLGRFMQTDPIGYGAGLNLYAYVGNDPVNRIDPYGLEDVHVNPTIVVTGIRGIASLQRYFNQMFMRMEFRQLQDRLTRGDDGAAELHFASTGSRLPCDNPQAFRNSGQVTFRGVTVSGAFLLGGGVTSGTFQTQSGISGTFTAGEFLIGFRAEAAGIVGFSRNLSTFAGGNDTLSASFLMDDATRATDMNGNFAGGSTTVGRGAAFGLTAGFSNTSVTVTHCPS